MPDPESTNFRESPNKPKHSFSIIYHELSRDSGLSLSALGLLVYLLSFATTWNISMPWVMRNRNISKNVIYKLINELIACGYMKRETYLDKGKKRYSYEFSSFKEYLLYPEKQDTEKQDPEKQDTIEEQENPYQDSLKKEEQIYKNRSQQVAPVSAEAESLYEFFFEFLKKHHPHLKEPFKKKWIEELDRMLRIDKRSSEEIKEAILWIPNDLWFKANILCAKSLRKSYDKILAKKSMCHEKELVSLNRKTALAAKEKYPNELKFLSFNDKFVSNNKLCKEVPFNLPHETFKSALASLFGGTHNAN